MCLNGKFVALELKKDAQARLAPIQEYNLIGINRSGGYGFRVDPTNWEEMKCILEAIACA